MIKCEHTGMPVVSPLDFKKGFAVVCRKRCEFLYMVAWSEDNDKGTPFLGLPKSYPIMICVGDEMSCWMDRMDRAVQYVEFKDYINK